MILEKIRSIEQNKPVLTYLCLKVFYRLSYCSTFNEKNIFVSLGANQYLLASFIKYLVDCASATLNYKIQ